MPFLLDTFLPGLFVTVKVPSIEQIDLFENHLTSIEPCAKNVLKQQLHKEWRYKAIMYFLTSRSKIYLEVFNVIKINTNVKKGENNQLLRRKSIEFFNAWVTCPYMAEGNSSFLCLADQRNSNVFSCCWLAGW